MKIWERKWWYADLGLVGGWVEQKWLDTHDWARTASLGISGLIFLLLIWGVWWIATNLEIRHRAS